ncbi:TlpA disulfide reductase family protein [Salinimicrobium xinjiangense]|uniref:TlpA disulfide reductase family protein n=1 Tax=Salinimicrobium xinjiangense TaxID=438596 RepID=UPI00041147DE|nr:TlpA disulfide reductase family protein [Salinimicrobium xinjiangense]
MKNLFFGTALIYLAASCNNNEKEVTPEPKGSSYVIQGEIAGGEGKRLALYIPGQNLDNRQITTIVDGRFEFCGSLEKPENAFITFEKEHEQQDGYMSIYEVFLTGDTIKLKAEVAEKHDNLFLENDTILQSAINQYHHATNKNFRKAYDGAMVFRDSIKNDSMRRHIYPAIRSRLISVYEQYYTNPDYSVVNLSRLRQLTEDRFLFDPRDLSEVEKTQLISFFEKIDTALEGTPNYNVVSVAMANLNNTGKDKEFIDFTLPDMLGRDQQLSAIIKKNEYTVLDFWWAGCLPCRKFNKANKEKYEAIKQQGIEVIGINVDMGRKQWESASRQDEIKWVNLYAGADSKIQGEYKITSFPTKIVVDRNFKVIEVDFNDLDELQEKLFSFSPLEKEKL